MADDDLTSDSESDSELDCESCSENKFSKDFIYMCFNNGD